MTGYNAAIIRFVRCKAGIVQKGGNYTIAVTDTDISSPPELQKNIFKYEETTNRTGTVDETGTGFGLPFSRDIMKAHGGELRVESEMGKGSTFYIILPLRVNATT